MKEMVEVGFKGFLIGGIGITIGGVLVFLLYNLRNVSIPLVISISVGLTSSILLLDIIPASIRVEGIWITAFGVGTGFMIIYVIGRFMHGMGGHGHTRISHDYTNSALVIAVAVAIHNFPTGIALGSSLAIASSVSWMLSLVMVLHAIPEGIAFGLPLLLSGVGLLRIINYTFIVALPTGIGAILGYYTGSHYEHILALLLAVAAGTILLVSYQEILKPALREIGIRKGFTGLIYGWFIGLFFLFTFHATHM